LLSLGRPKLHVGEPVVAAPAARGIGPDVLSAPSDWPRADDLIRRETGDIMRRALAAVALLSMLANAEAAQTDVRVYVLYGQGGRFMARGMEALATSLGKMDDRLQISVHEWKNHKDVAKDIAKLPLEIPVVLIGYSLGANATTWIANALPARIIDLIVAYDPSVLGEVQPARNNVRRVLLYHNNSPEPFGHARIRGPQVETVETRNSHLAISNSEWLHQKTRAAVSQVLAGFEAR
jgi:hypothetical protein